MQPFGFLITCLDSVNLSTLNNVFFLMSTFSIKILLKYVRSVSIHWIFFRYLNLPYLRILKFDAFVFSVCI